jgi:monoamine oxidase
LFFFFQSQWCTSITGFYVHHRLPNILVTQIHGEAAEYIETMPDELLSNCFQELFCRFYPDNQIPKPKQLIRSHWFNKSFQHGSHTFIELGSSIHHIKQLAKPCLNNSTEPKILFAGEGTHERFYGTMHGAFLTGIREAKRIIQFYQ